MLKAGATILIRTLQYSRVGRDGRILADRARCSVKAKPNDETDKINDALDEAVPHRD